jgi:hypothetical protein
MFPTEVRTGWGLNSQFQIQKYLLFFVAVFFSLLPIVVLMFKSSNNIIMRRVLKDYGQNAMRCFSLYSGRPPGISVWQSFKWSSVLSNLVLLKPEGFVCSLVSERMIPFYTYVSI